MDLQTLLNEALALKAAREDIVEKLNEDGFSADETTPLSEIAEMMRADGACLTPRLACYNTRRGTYQFYTRAEWEDAAANDNEFSYLLMLGMEIRAEGHRFIMAGRSSGGMQLATSGLNVPDLYYYGNDSLEMSVDDFDGAGNTDKIIAAGDNAGVNTPAPDWAKAYKTFKSNTKQDDDPQSWYIPAMGELLLMQKYKKRINDEITWFRNNPKGLFTANDLTVFEGAQNWSSTQYDTNSTWIINLSVGGPAYFSKFNVYYVRPISAIVNP